MTQHKTQQQISPAMRRLNNQAAMWRARYAGCATYADVVRVAVDRAKAAARSAERAGNGEAMKDLAQLITNWAEAMEQAAVKQAGR